MGDACEDASKLVRERPDAAHVDALLARYVRVPLVVEDEHLAPGDCRALRPLALASSWVDRIYLQQISPEGAELKRLLAAESDERLERLFSLNYGRWDLLDDNRPLWGSGVRPPGANFYPADLTREEFREHLAANPAERDQLTSRTTLVRRQGRELVAVPYTVAYREALSMIADALREASASVTHAGFRGFLRARAEGLTSGVLAPSDAAWVRLGDSPIDIAIGPFDMYDDGLLALKASYESTVMIRHPLSDRMTDFARSANLLERAFPGAAPTGHDERQIGVGVYDVVHVAGINNAGSKPIAATLPTDEAVVRKVGARLVLFRNIINAKFRAILAPLAQQMFSARDAASVGEEAFVLHTILHEYVHALGTSRVLREGRPTSTTIQHALGERHSAIEECRADLLGYAFLCELIRGGVVAIDPVSAASTFVAGVLRSVRFGRSSDHGNAALMIFAHLARSGAVKHGPDGRLTVDPIAVGAAVLHLGKEVHGVATSGDYEGAGRLLDGLARMPGEFSPLLRTLTIPVDVEFAFDRSRLGFS